MTAQTNCTTCGTPITAEVLGGKCPTCLKKVALMEPTFPEDTIKASRLSRRNAGWEPPSVEEVAALLPRGSYCVECLIGCGGMGAVYKGTQLRLKRPVAIKLMRQDQAADGGFKERFLREAHTLARLSHPGIVNVIDCGEAGPALLYIIMEFVDGADLLEVIRGGDLTQEQVLQILPQICEALQFAHDNGIVHRDIKPSNILLTRGGRVKIADFGLAKNLDPDSSVHTRTGVGMGTPDYAPPEQFTPGAQVDHRADIYALGVMIYQMITGQLPRGAWKPPSEKAKVDAQWDQIVARALQHDPRERYGSVSEVRTEITKITTRSTAAFTPTSGGDLKARGRAHPVLMLAALFAISIGGYLAWDKFKIRQSSINKAQLATLGATPAISGKPTMPTPTVVVGTEWTDLIPHIKPERDAVRGGWKSGKDGLICQNDVRWSLCTLPVQPPEGDYEVRYRLTRTAGPMDGFFFPFRRGLTGGSIGVDYPGLVTFDGMRRTAIERVNGRKLDEPGDSVASHKKEWLPVGKPCAVLLQVAQKEVRVSVDDVEVIRWQADWTQIQQSVAGTPWGALFSKLGSPVFGIGTYNNEAVFHSIEMRRIGEGKASTSAVAPAAATKDAPFENSLGMRFVPVPITGGPTDKQRMLFSMWETRVQDYEVFANETKREWPRPNFPQGPTHPVVLVTWEDAQAFCHWLTDRERKAGKLRTAERYRLPTDHEWSCAVGIGEIEDARKLPSEKVGGLGHVFPWGNSWPPPARSGNFADEESRSAMASGKYGRVKDVISGYHDGHVETAPAGSFLPERSGLHDLNGNVREWCEDWFDASRKERVLRGGCWDNSGREDLRSPLRVRYAESVRGIYHGFRCVLVAKE